MATSETDLNTRVELMDKNLKAAFPDFRAFITHAVTSLEKRQIVRFEQLEGRLDKVEGRLARLDRNVGLGFKVIDGRLGAIDRKLDQIEGRLGGLDRKLEQIARILTIPASRARPARRRR